MDDGKTSVSEIKVLGQITSSTKNVQEIAEALDLDVAEAKAILTRLIRRDLITWQRQEDGEVRYTAK